MADGKIYITISDSRRGSGSGVSNDADNTEEKENPLSKYARHRFFNFAEGQAKQFVNYTVGNIGNFTGNYIEQSEVQGMIRNISFLVNLGTAIYSGVKMTKSWVGGVIAGAISIGSQAINFGYQEYTETVMNRRTNRNIEMMRNRLGLQGLIDGSRTGGY